VRLSFAVERYPSLAACVDCAESRPAFKLAFDAQLAVFTAASTG
jgi:glutathione S-transferase